ncbi:MAG: phage Gp37/Gp68 family protein [Candidatus Methylomirabilis sp.]|nr:phage Gp37/Gp68 family protein [Deltaproteobacteria bacterium]
MAVNSSIEWTESTWNPVTGCSKISPGCKNCYAERMAKRLQAMGQLNYSKGFTVSMHEHVLDYPLKWRKPQLIFVNSMGDLFHKSVSDNFILSVFDVMKRADWHIYQVLTKRSDRLAQLAPRLPWASHIWMGVSIENEDYIYRANHLRQTSAHVKFLSVEPLLGPVKRLNLKGIDWVIAGGESGPGARYIDPSWVINVRDKCQKMGVPFFFKQWGGIWKKKTGRQLEGRTWDEMPTVVGL